MFSFRNYARHTVLAAAAVASLATIVTFSPARAQDAGAAATKSAEDTYKEIEKSMGKVPTFLKLYPKAAVAGAWAQERDLELSDKTALSPKVKALISLAVSAQIPCQYCIWADTKSAKQFGATQDEIAEAVAMAALTRHWSTFLNGMQVDFQQFKTEMGGE
jgi:AhpD family alkylhydroperoxidase